MTDAIKFMISVATPVAVGGLSGYVTARGVSTWYPTLVKPPFNPRAWISFASVLKAALWWLKRPPAG